MSFQFKIPKPRFLVQKKIWADTLIILGVAALLLLLLEAALRFLFPQILIGTPIFGESFYKRYELIGPRYTPGAKWEFKHPEFSVTYTINDDGFRDNAEHPVPKPGSTTRVLLVGDSFTFGYGVDYDSSWAVSVENRLKSLGRRNIELIKAGVQGMDTREEFRWMRELSEKYRPDVVVLGFTFHNVYTNSLDGLGDLERHAPDAPARTQSAENPIEENGIWYNLKKRIFVRPKELHLLSFVIRMLIANDAIYKKLYLANLQNREFLTFPLSVKAEEQVATTKTLFTHIAEYCRARGMKLIVFSMPQQFQAMTFGDPNKESGIDVTYYDRYFSDVANKNNFLWIETLERFAQASTNGGKLYYRMDGHMNPAGNEFLADIFLEKIVPVLTK